VLSSSADVLDTVVFVYILNFDVSSACSMRVLLLRMAGAQAAGTISLTQVGSYMFLKFVSGFPVLQCLATFCFSMGPYDCR
jgi:hypothetical protein